MESLDSKASLHSKFDIREHKHIILTNSPVAVKPPKQIFSPHLADLMLSQDLPNINKARSGLKLNSNVRFDNFDDNFAMHHSGSFHVN